MNKTITLVAALGSNRGIGLDGKLPWHLPAELQHFKRRTMGKPVVMGRRTWEAIGRPLPGRQNLVVSRNSRYVAEGCQVLASLAEAVAAAVGFEIMVIGGGELYRQALPLASRMVLTMVDMAPDADTWFPEWETSEWMLVARQRHPPDAHNRLAFEINEWVRKRAPG